MNKISTFILIVVLALANSAYTQCDSIVSMCQKHMDDRYISDGQVYWAMLSGDEPAEFQTIFFGGNTYRIAAQSGMTNGNLVFRVLDPQGKELFSNKGQANAPYWDFRVDSTLTVSIEAQLDNNKVSDGCSVLLIGFKR